MRVRVQEWGNSLAVRLPNAIAREVGIEYGSSVDLLSTGRGIVIRPAARKYSLEEMLEGIRESNLHNEVDTGSPTGKEAW
ncbi:MAG: AbrB/MazE/SpoVT family DNA-binding domain-containing protein [Ignavibacteriales bacterium]